MCDDMSHIYRYRSDKMISHTQIYGILSISDICALSHSSHHSLFGGSISQRIINQNHEIWSLHHENAPRMFGVSDHMRYLVCFWTVDLLLCYTDSHKFTQDQIHSHLMYCWIIYRILSGDMSDRYCSGYPRISRYTCLMVSISKYYTWNSW